MHEWKNRWIQASSSFVTVCDYILSVLFIVRWVTAVLYSKSEMCIKKHVFMYLMYYTLCLTW